MRAQSLTDMTMRKAAFYLQTHGACMMIVQEVGMPFAVSNMRQIVSNLTMQIKKRMAMPPIDDLNSG